MNIKADALTGDVWHLLSPHLDHALALDELGEAQYIAELRSRDEKLADALAALLDEHRQLECEGFLEQPPGLPPPQAGAGDVVGAYRLLAPIGFGGMGTVWLAERSDGRFSREVAVKIPNFAFAGHGEERFRREGSIVARLTHPCIAQLLDAGVTSAGQPFLVLEHVAGKPIDCYCDESVLDVTARLRLLLEVIDAVAHAHANLIVHRDLKPSNVLVTPGGTVKLLDFGIAKLLEAEARPPTLLTRETGVGMTPEFAAPEQLTGEAITTATDVYALGVLMYLLLTGQHPVAASRGVPADLIRAVVEREPVRPSEAVFTSPTSNGISPVTAAASRRTSPDKLRRTLKGDLDTIVLKALKKDPADRYVSVNQFAEDIQRWLDGLPIRARPDSRWYRSGRFVRRHKTGVALAAASTLALLAFTWYSVKQSDSLALERDRARMVVSFLADLVDGDDPPQGDPAPAPLHRLLELDVNAAGLTETEQKSELREIAAQLRVSSSALRRAQRVRSVTAGARILWVDDRPAGNRYEILLLESLGIQVVTATNTREAIQKLEAESWNLVLSDLERERRPLEGLRLLEWLHDQGRHMPVVYYTIRPPVPDRPPGSFGMTTQPDELVHLVFDVLERN